MSSFDLFRTFYSNCPHYHRLSYSGFLKACDQGKRNHEKIDKKIIIICGSIVLSVCMIIVDWKLALFILAVILGKYIWIDFVFDYKGIVTSIKEYKAQYFYFGFNSISIAINILSQFASTFVISTVVLGVIDWTPYGFRLSRWCCRISRL